MALINCYVQTYGQLPDFFGKIQSGQAPDKFTQQHLKDIGFASTNHRAFIPLMKALDFLSSEGVPTKRYHEYRNYSQSKKIMGEALKEAYSDLFVISSLPKQSDIALIKGKFISTFNATDRTADLMAKTFFALLGIAEISESRTSAPKPVERTNAAEPMVSEVKDTKLASSSSTPKLDMPSLHYNIEIHLPATKDIEVYNSIFKSIKEHLIG